MREFERIVSFVLLLCFACSEKSQNDLDDEQLTNTAWQDTALLLQNLDKKATEENLAISDLAQYAKENGATKITFGVDVLWFVYEGVRGVYRLDDSESWYEREQMALSADETQQFALMPAGNGKVGIFSPYFQKSGDMLEKMFLENSIGVTNNHSLSLSDVRDFEDYQLTIVNTHGGVAFGEFYFFTSDTITAATDLDSDFAKNSLGIGMRKHDNETRLIVFPKYFDVANIDFQDNSILYFNACQSLANETLASKLYNNHNLGVYVGWTNKVQMGYFTFTSYVFFKYLLEGLDIADTIYNGEEIGGEYCEEFTEFMCQLDNLLYYEECLTTFSGFCDFGEHTEQVQKGAEYMTKLNYTPKFAEILVFMKEIIKETSGEVGDPCETNGDCNSEMCQYSLDDSLPGGYCVASCSTTVNCPDSAWCIFDSEKSGICYKQCDTDVNCRTGYYCQEVNDGAGNRVCWPKKWLEIFHAENLVCGEIYYRMPSFECQEGLICGKIQENFYKNGICQKLCTVSSDCNAGRTCTPVLVEDISANKFCGVCQKYNANAAVGDLCYSDQDCHASNLCIGYSDGNGYCSLICMLGSSSTCGTGLTCWEIESVCQNKGICAP